MKAKPDFHSATQPEWNLACEREAVIRPLAQADSLSPGQVDAGAVLLGLSRSSVYRLVARFKTATDTSLLPAKAGRHGLLRLLLTSYRSLLPLREASDLCHPRLRSRLLSLTEGVTVRICRLLEAAAIQAIESGCERIDAGLLSDELVTHNLVSISDRRVRRTTG